MKNIQKCNNLILQHKINQMFILGFHDNDYEDNNDFVDLIKHNLGGVIFFTRNIKTIPALKNNIKTMKKLSMSPMFFSVDQEGGRVERTENIHNGKKYLSAKYSAEKGVEFLKSQTNLIAKELKDYGFNMNFSPVLDVNTNPENPIIGERAYSDNPMNVIKFSKIVYDEYISSGIIPVCKHFPGHGDTSVDSHFEMPVCDLNLNELEKLHVSPFISAIKDEIPAIMVSHVNYKAFDENIPASLSYNIIEKYLRNKLKFDGVVISDDMEMGGVKKYNKFDAVIKAINAGVNLFIFRENNSDVIQMLKNLYLFANDNEDIKQKIEFSYNKIKELKKRFLY